MPPTPTATQEPAIAQWRGAYFVGAPTGLPVLVRDDPVIVFDWGYEAPAPGLPADAFSARWTRQVNLDQGTYRVHALADDGVRVWVDDQLIIDAWSNYDNVELVVDHVVVQGAHALRVEYHERVGQAQIQVWWKEVASPTFPEWKGEYWPNRELRGEPALVRADGADSGANRVGPGIDLNWKAGSPAFGLPTDDFSARWTRTPNFEAATYLFRVLVDDGVRLWVDGELLIDAWYDSEPHELTVERAMVRGTHAIQIEYYEHSGSARIGVWWAKIASPSFPNWKGEYWPNRDLSGNPVLVRDDGANSVGPGIDFSWGTGAAANGLPADNFSAHWSRQETFQPGIYRFYALVDDSMRLYVDGTRIVDEWHGSTNEVYTVDRALDGAHHLTVEYAEHKMRASACGGNERAICRRRQRRQRGLGHSKHKPRGMDRRLTREFSHGSGLEFRPDLFRV